MVILYLQKFSFRKLYECVSQPVSSHKSRGRGHVPSLSPKLLYFKLKATTQSSTQSMKYPTACVGSKYGVPQLVTSHQGLTQVFEATSQLTGGHTDHDISLEVSPCSKTLQNQTFQAPMKSYNTAVITVWDFIHATIVYFQSIIHDAMHLM